MPRSQRSADGYDAADGTLGAGPKKSRFVVYYENGKACTSALNKQPAEAARKGVHAAFADNKLNKNNEVKLLVLNKDKEKWYGYACRRTPIPANKLTDHHRRFNIGHIAKVVRVAIEGIGCEPKPAAAQGPTLAGPGSPRARKVLAVMPAGPLGPVGPAGRPLSPRSKAGLALAYAQAQAAAAAAAGAGSPRRRGPAVLAGSPRKRGPAPLDQQALMAAYMAASAGSPRGTVAVPMGVFPGSPRRRRPVQQLIPGF